jgi:hypothetical protein
MIKNQDANKWNLIFLTGFIKVIHKVITIKDQCWSFPFFRLTNEGWDHYPPSPVYYKDVPLWFLFRIQVVVPFMVSPASKINYIVPPTILQAGIQLFLLWSFLDNMLLFAI